MLSDAPKERETDIYTRVIDLIHFFNEPWDALRGCLQRLYIKANNSRSSSVHELDSHCCPLVDDRFGINEKEGQSLLQ